MSPFSIDKLNSRPISSSRVDSSSSRSTNDFHPQPPLPPLLVKCHNQHKDLIMNIYVEVVLPAPHPCHHSNQPPIQHGMGTSSYVLLLTNSQRVDRGGRPCICWWLGLLIGNCVHALGVADDLIWIEIHILWKTEGKTLAFQSKSHFKFVNLSTVRSIIQYGCHSGRSQTGIQDSITSSRTYCRGPLDSHCFSPE